MPISFAHSDWTHLIRLAYLDPVLWNNLGEPKVGHLQPFYLFLSRLGCSLDELQDVWPDKFCQAKHPEDQNPASIYGQDMELLMTESHMHLQDIKSSPHLLPRTATEVCLPSG